MRPKARLLAALIAATGALSGACGRSELDDGLAGSPSDAGDAAAERHDDGPVDGRPPDAPASKGGTWMPRKPGSGPKAPPWPAARFAHAMAYDELRGVTVLFGGVRTRPAGSTLSPFLADLWEWDGGKGAWTDRTPTTLPAAWPPARGHGAMVFDVALGTCVLFGGAATGPYKDTWQWDGARGAWSRYQTTILGDTGPDPRADPALAYDDDRGSVMLFGGAGENGPFGDLWEWDGDFWRRHVPISPDPRIPWPAGRFAAALAWDALQRRLVLFGGAGRGTLQDLWQFDADAGTWRWPTQLVSPDLQPPPRSGHTLTYDVGRGVEVVLGGRQAEGGVLGDLWEWDGLAWTRRAPTAAHPAPRYEHAAVYDRRRHLLVAFGGHDANGPLGDLWEWDGR